MGASRVGSFAVSPLSLSSSLVVLGWVCRCSTVVS